MGERTYHGVYPVRSIGKDMGIHIPDGIVGDFAIFQEANGNLTLEKVGEKKKVPG